MAPLLALVGVTLVGRLLGRLGVDYLDTWPQALAAGLAALFLLTSSAHLFQPRRAGLIAIVPPAVPFPALAVTVTGVLELAGAVGLLVPPASAAWIRPVAAACLGMLMLAMFPANVYAAGRRRHPSAPTTPLGRRALVQLLYLAAAVAVTVTAV
ncbi:hypothetical protein GCG21_10275 [Pseudactinotalea sp. HY160]|uniref:DoxX family protein n=1 Tax=Pseudactinotalea sp. HY160 TaxID=2654490 RepID=UPI00128CE34B|nr:DoxX family protein [Pseudactinotalea sp. HY160]MPV50381.1 hypothetical protein [Pseudactinotalea sp. HY160]